MLPLSSILILGTFVLPRAKPNHGQCRVTVQCGKSSSLREPGRLRDEHEDGRVSRHSGEAANDQHYAATSEFVYFVYIFQIYSRYQVLINKY